MSTLVQIESAVAGLPPQDQWTLLAWLQKRLSAKDESSVPVSTDHQKWLHRLEQLRKSVGTGKLGSSSEEILDDLRSERR